MKKIFVTFKRFFLNPNMLNLYYRIWVDCIIRARKQPKNRYNWQSMSKYYNFFFLLAFILNQPEGQYQRHKQFCGGLNGVDYKWSLDIEKDGSYIFQTTSKKNEFLSTSKNDLILGVCEVSKDTLKLFKSPIKDSVIIFYLNGDKLVYLKDKSNIKNKSLFFLDYLEKVNPVK